MKNARAASAETEAIRRYSLNWLMQAACRVYQRGMDVYYEHERQLRSAGVSGLFDLSDTTTSTGRWKRLA